MLNVHSIVLVFQAAWFPFHCFMFSPQGYEARPAPCLKTQLGGMRGRCVGSGNTGTTTPGGPRASQQRASQPKKRRLNSSVFTTKVKVDSSSTKNASTFRSVF